MRGKSFGIIAVLFLAVVFVSMNFVSAEVTNFTILNPVANANATGTFTVVANVTNITGALNVTVRWWNGTSGGWLILCSNASIATNGNATCAVGTSVIDANVSSSIFNITAVETSGIAANSSNVTGLVIDNTAPVITIKNYVNGTYRTTVNLTLNITLEDINMTNGMACIVEVNGTNTTFSLDVDNSTFGTCNTTAVSLLGSNDGNTTIKVYAGRNTTSWNANLFGANNTQVVFIDRNAPALEASATEITKEKITLVISTVDGTGTGTNTCTADRAGATVTTTSLTESSLSCATAYTYVITCTDRAGNAGTLSKTFSTNACGAAGATTSSGVAPRPTINNVASITPGAASVTTYTDATLGIKTIEISVDNPAQNVQVSVTKYDSKPAAVSVAKTGKVYQYLQIETKNVADQLDKAKVQFKVTKAWATANGLAKEKMTVYKFDETTKMWNELATTLSSEDDTYYYLDAELTSFSYFAISERSLAAGEGTDVNGEVAESGGSSIWVWIVVIVLIIALVAWLLMRNKN